MARKDSSLVLNYTWLLNTLGLIGLTMPIVLTTYSWGFMGLPVQASVSDYYHSHMGDYFVANSCFLGLMFLFYRGYPLQDIHRNSPYFWHRIPDRWVSFPAGIGAILVGLFPVRADDCAWLADALANETIASELKASGLSLYCQPEGFVKFNVFIHYIGAGVFLFCSALFCILLFTRGNGTEHNVTTLRGQSFIQIKWSQENIFFATCGMIILICLAFLGLDHFYFTSGSFHDFSKANQLFYWVEVISIWAFAAAWLEQGRAWYSPFRWFSGR